MTESSIYYLHWKLISFYVHRFRCSNIPGLPLNQLPYLQDHPLVEFKHPLLY